MEVSVSDCDIKTLAAVTVTVTATAVTTVALQPNKAHNVIRVQAPAANTAAIYAGDSTLTTSNGLEIAAGTYMDFYVRSGAKLYLVVATATQNARIAVM